MTDGKKTKDWQIANESFGAAQQLRPKEQGVGKSFAGASGFTSGPIASNNTNAPVNSGTAPVPKPTK